MRREWEKAEWRWECANKENRKKTLSRNYHPWLGLKWLPLAHSHTHKEKHKHTHVHAIERWIESSLKSNQCPIDFDTFRGLRGIHSIVCRTLNLIIGDSADDSGESFQKLHTSKNKLTLISFVRWKINGSSVPDLCVCVRECFSSLFFAKSRKKENFDTSANALPWIVCESRFISCCVSLAKAKSNFWHLHKQSWMDHLQISIHYNMTIASNTHQSIELRMRTCVFMFVVACRCRPIIQ